MFRPAHALSANSAYKEPWYLERAPLSRVRLLLAWIAGCMLGLLALRQVRTKLLHQSEYFQLQLRQQEVLQQISARTCHLQDTDWDVYQVG